MKHTNSQHTPGPWRMDDRTNVKIPYAVIDASNITVAHILQHSLDPKHWAEANAALIAAAPEMLAVIPKLLKAIDIAIDRSDLENGDTFGIHHNSVMDAIDEARAAIAKATQSR